MKRSRSMPRAFLGGLLWGSLVVLAGGSGAAEPEAGPWRAVLRTPGGELPFGLSLRADAEASWVATVHNGPEEITVPRVEVVGDSLVLAFPHYASRIAAGIHDEGRRLEGEWAQVRDADTTRRIHFSARAGQVPRFQSGRVAAVENLSGRWLVDFSRSEDTSVAEFEVDDAGTATGTFRTTTGDYRFLAGVQRGGVLRLSTFDGAHAFLFHARLTGTGRLDGDFWSGAHWHETWQAIREPSATLPDAFSLTHWTEGASLSDLSFPDLHGVRRRLDDPAFAGRTRILYVFGSWCPNCSDATEVLVELHERYRDAGLSILGLAFESTGEFARDAAAVRRYSRRHGVQYPLLIAGLRDKEAASEAFPLLDRVRSYPTTIFIDGEGNVRAIHTGFSGPATGKEHLALRQRFEALVEEMLAEATPRRDRR